PLYQGQGKRRAVDRDIHFRQQERDGADVVFVAVRQDQPADMLAILLQIGKIRGYDVNPKEFGLREHHPGVDHDNILAEANRHGMHAEFAQTAEWNDLQLAVAHRRISVSDWNSTCYTSTSFLRPVAGFAGTLVATVPWAGKAAESDESDEK